MRKIEKVVSIVTGSLVASFAVLAGYTVHGPVLSEPVIVTVPDSVMNVVCGVNAYGCYRTSLPDLIVMNPDGAAHPATLPHEMLHYEHPTWSECEVSDYLVETTGLRDGYRGEC